MKLTSIIFQFFVAVCLTALSVSCSQEKKSNGFSVNHDSPEEASGNKAALSSDTLGFLTRPNGILLTGDEAHRLVPIYKLNQRERRGEISYFTGQNSFHYSYNELGNDKNNNWNRNFMPGFEAMYGYKMVNVQHHHTGTKQSKQLFSKPVLINTLYYPTYSKDTLNNLPVRRNYMMVSAYTEDTNQDGVLDRKDLRRFLLFDMEGQMLDHLVPVNYSVRSSQYDPANDYMYVYAVLDENKNGHHDETEEVHVFWIDLKQPENRGRMYE